MASDAANHYSMLAAIERPWHLGRINETCSVHGSDLISLFH